MEKKPRFLKGKKKVKDVKEEVVAVCGPAKAPLPAEEIDTKVVVVERGKRRTQMIDRAEVKTYKMCTMRKRNLLRARQVFTAEMSYSDEVDLEDYVYVPNRCN